MDAEQGIPVAKNLLGYYAIGEIGKSSFSERLEGWVNCDFTATDEWGLKRSTNGDATGRIDLYRPHG
jgi:hypothetical protein